MVFTLKGNISMALTPAQMLAAIHKANPSTTTKRYSPAELKAAYSKLVASKSPTTSNTGGDTVTGTTVSNSGNDTAIPPGTTGDGTGATTGLTQADIDKLHQTQAEGEIYGNHLIDTLGLRGDFLGNVQEGPDASYYSDLAALRGRLSTAGDPTALDNEALGYARNALGGLTAPENSALRSAAVQDVNRQFGQQQAQLMRFQGGNGSAIQRAAQIGQLGASRVDAQRNLARDVLIANIQAKQQARDAFANLTNTVGARTDQRVATLSGLVQGGDQYANTMTQQGQEYNAGSRAAEIASRSAAMTGGMGVVSGQLGGYQASDFQAKALQDALDAKDREIAATKAIADAQNASTERIMKSLAGKI